MNANLCKIAVYLYAGFAFATVLFNAAVGTFRGFHASGLNDPLFLTMRLLGTVTGFLEPCAMLGLLWLVTRRNTPTP